VSRSTVAHVDLSALAHNYRVLAGFVATRTAPRAGGPLDIPAADRDAFVRAEGTLSLPLAAPAAIPSAKGPGIICVVKANAYGHGAARVAASCFAAPACACPFSSSAPSASATSTVSSITS
jgi:hypothetical protein